MRASRNESSSGEEILEFTSEELETKIAEGWRQGMLLSRESSRELSGLEMGEEERLIISMQTCDLLINRLELEPTVELLRAEIRPGPVPRSAGKSFRYYELGLADNVENHLFIHSRPRIDLDRSLVFQKGVKDDLQLESRGYRWFARWLGEKYIRPAYPNAFDQRLGSRRKNKIAKAVGNLDSCRAMYLTMSSWEELPESQAYSVGILLLMKHGATQEEQGAAETALAKICGLMTDAGHDVDDTATDVIIESEITVHNFRKFFKWSLDYVSLRNPEHEEPPAS